MKTVSYLLNYFEAILAWSHYYLWHLFNYYFQSQTHILTYIKFNTWGSIYVFFRYISLWTRTHQTICCKAFLSWNNKANLRDLIAATGLVISNWIQIVNFSACVTVKFDGWPRKTLGHFFYTTSSFVHHFKSIDEFKLDLQSRNAQFGSKLVICYHVWPWNLMNDNRAPLLCYFKLCAAFCSHWWIQTGVTVRKRSIWVKFDDF